MSRNAEYSVKARDVPRDLFPTGKVRFSLGVPPTKGRRKMGAAEKRREMLDRLRTWHAWDVLRGVQDGIVTVSEVCRRIEQGGESAVGEIRRDLESARMGGCPTFSEQLAGYLVWFEREKGAQTLAGVKASLERIGRTIGDVPIDRISRHDLEGAIHATGTAPSTMETYRTRLSGFWRWSIEMEAEAARMEKRLPRWTVNVPRLIPAKQMAIRVATATEDQVLRLLAAAEPYQEAYVRAYVHLGLRRDELTHTRMHLDLDVDEWTWRIQPRPTDTRCSCRNCQSPKGWSPKSHTSVRTLLVPESPAELRGAIARYLSLYPCEPGDFVFRNPRTGRAWTQSKITTDFEALCKRAGVKYGQRTPGGLTLHVLRHTCATELVRSGVDSAIGAAILGDQVQTFVKVYVHLSPSDLADGIRRGPRYEV